jgi:hypothetical protein
MPTEIALPREPGVGSIVEMVNEQGLMVEVWERRPGEHPAAYMRGRKVGSWRVRRAAPGSFGEATTWPDIVELALGLGHRLQLCEEPVPDDLIPPEQIADQLAEYFDMPREDVLVEHHRRKHYEVSMRIPLTSVRKMNLKITGGGG